MASSSSLVPVGQAGLTPQSETWALAFEAEEPRQYQHILSVAESQEQRLSRYAALRKSPGYDLSDPWLDVGDSKGGCSRQRLVPGAPCRLVGGGDIVAYLGPGPDGGCRVRFADGSEAVRARDRLLPLPTRAARQGDWAFPVDLIDSQVQYHGRRGLCTIGGFIPGTTRRAAFWVSFEPADPTHPPEQVLFEETHLMTLPTPSTGAVVTPWEAKFAAGKPALLALDLPPLPDEAAVEQQLMLRDDDDEDDDTSGSVDLGGDSDNSEAEEDRKSMPATLACGSLVQVFVDGKKQYACVEFLYGKKRYATIKLLDRKRPDGTPCDSTQEEVSSALTVVQGDDLVLGAVCMMCGVADPEPDLMLCENFAKSCLGSAHIRCLKPPLSAVPEDAWFCERCVILGKRRASSAAPSGSGQLDGREMNKSSGKAKAKAKSEPKAAAKSKSDTSRCAKSKSGDKPEPQAKKRAR